jgi:hypothetical protein
MRDWQDLTALIGAKSLIVGRVRDAGSGIAVVGAFELPRLDQ